MPYPAEHTAVIAESSGFQPDSITSKDVPGADGIRILMGMRKGSKTEEPVSFRFDASKFTADEAKAWLTEKKIQCQAFEPATGDAPDDAPPSDAPPEKPAPEQMADGTYRLRGVEVLAAGTFNASKGGKVTITDDDLAAIEQGTTECMAALKPPVKLGHGDEGINLFPKGGAPAFGWVEALSLKGGKLLADLTHVPKALVTALQQGRWRRQSAELIGNYKNPQTGKTYPRVMKALAFLGAELPAIQTLDDLVRLEAECTSALELTLTFDALNEPEPLADGGDANPNPPAPDGAGTGEVCEKCGQPIQQEPPTTEDEPGTPEGEPTTDPTSKEDEVSDEQVKALQAQIREEKAKRYTMRLDSLVKDRRIRPASVTPKLQQLVELSDDMAEQELTLLSQNAQFADDTKPLADGVPPDEKKPDKKGVEKLIELQAEIQKKDPNMSPGDALIQASLQDAAATVEYIDTYGLTPGPKEV